MRHIFCLNQVVETSFSFSGYPPARLVGDLFSSRDPDRSKALMTALDAIDGRFGRGAARRGGFVERAGWSMRRANLSPCYTTRIKDILPVLT
ncbi:hypothetical protein NS277_07285 [Novosphingobium barchaimii]|nr:hypothetical protein NS277_07285 [Novosphingobium barchaimii]